MLVLRQLLVSRDCCCEANEDANIAVKFSASNQTADTATDAEYADDQEAATSCPGG